ncbi:MAG: LysR family transcriptional regulator [Pseudomonadota bacterium]
MNAFVEVAKHGGFAAAARSTGISTSSINRQVIELETWLGITLFQRTTRKLSLTQEGSNYLIECQNVLDGVARIENMADKDLAQPAGTLRVTAPVFFAKECLHHLVPDFLNHYPEIKIEISAADRFVDLIDEGFDLALRIGDLDDSTLVARRLGVTRLVIVASPGYLKTKGTPKQIGEIKNHNCIVDSVAHFKNKWPLNGAATSRQVSVAGNVTVNNGEVARNLAMAGTGLTLLPHFFVRNQLEHGELVEILADQVHSHTGIFAVYPQNRYLRPKVRVFIDHVASHFAQMDQSKI